MFNNRLVKIMFIILGTLTMIGVPALVLYHLVFNDEVEGKEPSIDEILKVSVETEEITTNLLSDHIIRTSFVIQLDNKKAKEEVEKRSFQVENIIIQELSDRKESDFRGSEGINELENSIGARINEIMQEGYVVDVYINQRLIQ